MGQENRKGDLRVSSPVKSIHLNCPPWLYFLDFRPLGHCTLSQAAKSTPTPVKELKGFPGGSDGKAASCDAGDLGSIPGLGRSSRRWHGNLLQYSCLENSTGRGGWRATGRGVANSQTRLSNFTFFLSYWLISHTEPKGIYLFLSWGHRNSLAVQWLGLCPFTAMG